MKCFYHCGDQLPEIFAKNFSASIRNTLDVDAVLYDSFNGHLDSQAKVLLQIPGRVLFFSDDIDYRDVPQETQLKRIADIHDHPSSEKGRDPQGFSGKNGSFLRPVQLYSFILFVSFC